ncbi:histidine kinase [Desulfosporosinus sp. HMP52]|uniref:response regulator n=1 Tax=Desulfosporosinus sp. HMP52 TaxID=1487923 RepID=UPI00051FC8FD|nr:response regulator [Desulfosporosinus sp. HMP52]KGK88654.1 histidine kinase [Desulfosporosinus sp. HMP52]
MKRNFVNKSFKHKLRATYTMLMFIVLVLLCTFLYYQVDNIIKPLISHIGLQVVDGEARYLGEGFNNQANMLEQLASTETFKKGQYPSVKKEIDKQMNRNNLWSAMKYRWVTGEEYASNPDNLKDADFAKQLLAGDQLTLISKPVFDENDAEYVTYIGTKVMDEDGNLKGSIIINIPIKRLMGSFVEEKMSKFTEMWIFDSNGKAIINPNLEKPSPSIENFKDLVTLHSSGELKIIQEDRVNYLIYAKIPNSEGLYLAIGIEHSESLEAMRFLLFLIIAGAVGACLFIFIAANKMTTVMTKPLTRMVEIIQHSDGTNLIEIPYDLKASKDEIGILANTIDEMARNIRNNVQTLNNEIKERQRAEAELIRLNVELECRVKDRTLALTEVTNNLAISEDRFRIAMEASHIGLYDSNCNNNVLVVNGIFLNLINAPGYQQGLIKESDWVQFKGQLEDYVYDKDLSNFTPFREENLPMIGEDFYTEVRLKADPNIWFSFIGQVIERDGAGNVQRFIGVLQNITERKRIEVELKAAMEEAEEASQAKSQFLANMSHEIRTPMNAIMGLTHLLRQSDLKDTQKSYVLKTEEASKALLRIINDILDFSKIEAGKLEIEMIQFNLDKVLENISNLYTISATNKGIDINFDRGEAVPEELIGDPFRLEQILSNLITNAIKFTDQGEVNVSVRVFEETEDKVKLHFRVADTGIGIKEEHIGKLFSAFTQADGSTTRKYGGTGLGLTISKQLVELMNGEIWVESVYGEGASFEVLLQFKKDSALIKPNFADYPDLRGKKVLVVDHNKTSLVILERMLCSFSLEVTALNNPFEAIELMHQIDFDLLVLDYNLPDLSGIEMYKRLVANTEITLPKTIFVSAAGRESYYTQANQLGIKYFLVKPINQSLMFDAVMNALKGRAWSQAGRIHNEEVRSKFREELTGKRLLLVEDNEINQLVAKDILEQAGIHVSIADNGQEAIKYVHANRYDAVLMDVQMPIMDGYRATEILRESYSSEELPIIAMTANALRGDREKSIEAGMNDYISKPIEPILLFETLEKWLVSKTTKSLGTHANQRMEILDYERTLSRLGNKQEFYSGLLKKYSDSYSHLAEDLTAMRMNHQYEDAKRLIHSLKSVSGNIGAIKLSTFIIQLEEDYESYKEQDLAQKLDELSKLNLELTETINKILSIKDPKQNLLSSHFDLGDALSKLAEALEKARAKEIKDIISELGSNPQELPFSTQINEIKKLVNRYRYKEAKVMVKELLNLIKEQSHE